MKGVIVIILICIGISVISLNMQVSKIYKTLIQIQKYEEKTSWEVGERVTLRDGCPAIIITP